MRSPPRECEGWLPDGVHLDRRGRVVVGSDSSTSVEGLFAAGDIRAGTAALLAESAEDGERAGHAAAAYAALPASLPSGPNSTA